jgi:hypothetical protein
MERVIQSPNEGVMPPERYSVVGSSDLSWDFRLSEVPTGVGTSESLKKPTRVSRVIPTSRVLTKVRSFDYQEFRPKSGILTDLIKRHIWI